MALLTALIDQLTEVAMKIVMVFIERNLVPDFIIRPGIRHLLGMRLKEVRTRRASSVTRSPLAHCASVGTLPPAALMSPR